MGETLHLLFGKRDDGTYELQVREHWSGHVARGSFVPPFSTGQLNILHKKLNALESGEQKLRGVGQRLFQALCGSETTGTLRNESSEQSVQAMLRRVIQRTLRHRGTVALTFSFGPGCDEFVRYPWELLHNGEHFLLASGVFTLTRALLRPNEPAGSELPVRPPLRVLYLSAAPGDCVHLETGRSLDALGRALANLIEDGRVILDKLEQVTYDQLVEYMDTVGGSGRFNDAKTAIPCYVVHFDGHGAYGRLCSNPRCEQLNEPDARQCVCGASLRGVKPQTYLSFCNDEGNNRYIDTGTLRELFVSSDVRLAVLSACETAALSCETRSHQIAFDSTLATALVMAQVPAVVAMPFSVEDDLSPTFVYHFYQALAEGRMLEEALARARHAMLPTHRPAWFIPVLYRHISDKDKGPVALLADQNAPEEHDPLLALPGSSISFIGRERELRDLDALLTAAAHSEEQDDEELDSISGTSAVKLHPGIHHIALTGSIGIGKSALAMEVVRRNSRKFSGGVIAISLQGGKSFGDALIEIAHALNVPVKVMQPDNLQHREDVVLNALRTRAGRELPCLLVVDGFEEIKEHTELEHWHRFLCSLPQEVVVLLTSRTNPTSMSVLEGALCRWYEYSVGQMTNADLMKLFAELASTSGLDQRIHLDDPRQQVLLREICELLDGYPLGAELIFGAARLIEGKLYAPEAATRSLEEVRDELVETPLAGIGAVLDVSYRRLSPAARLLLSYLAAFRLPFSREQIKLIVAPEKLTATQDAVRLHGEHTPDHAGDVIPADLAHNWQGARDELVGAAFMQFDGRVYTIHPQVRNFALVHLPMDERRRVHRVVAAYYAELPQPTPYEWFVAFEHLEGAGEPQDVQAAVRLAVRASWAMSGRGHTERLMAMLRKAEADALRLGDKTGAGQIQCCLGAILRQRGQFALALPCLNQSLMLHREQNELHDAAWALYELAMLAREVGNFKQAGEHAQEALTLFRDTGYATGEAWMQMVMGEVSRGCGRYYEALGHFDLALTSFRNLYNEEGIASTLRDYGTVHEALGNYTKALTNYAEALRIFNSLGLRAGQGWVLADRSVVYADQGKLDIAEKECREAITIFREQGLRRGEGWALRAMGEIAQEGHHPGDARGFFEEAESIFRELGDRVDLARVLNALGAITFDEQDFLLAKDLYEQAFEMAQEQEARQIVGRALRGLGDINRVMHNSAEAADLYQQAYAIAQTLETPAELCAVLRRQGLLKVVQQRYSEALEYWVKALEHDKRLVHPVRIRLENDLQNLVTEHQLEEAYLELSRSHGLE
ncbi:MAG: tetratricopeptide repeat protein [Ktedonobacteraceae bacterium]